MTHQANRKKYNTTSGLCSAASLLHASSFRLWTHTLSHTHRRAGASIKICFPTIRIGHGTASHGNLRVGVGRGKERREGSFMCNTLKKRRVLHLCFVRGPADMGKHLLRRNRDWWLKLCAGRGSASKDGERQGGESGLSEAREWQCLRLSRSTSETVERFHLSLHSQPMLLWLHP